jgi:hypothetical protein
MAFFIVNRRNTFLTVQLNGPIVQVGPRSAAGPFPDTEKSADVERKEYLGDIFINPVPEKKPGSKTPKALYDKRFDKPQDEKNETSEG